MLENLILRWGYAAIGVGTFFEGEAVLLAGGALAHRGLLSLPLVLAAAFLGSLAGDQLWFHLGRRFGRPFLRRSPGLRRRAGLARAWLRRYGAVFVAGFRFVYGLRTVTPVLLGSSAYPAGRFTVLNGLGAALWSAAVGGAGWALGAGLSGLIRRTARLEELAAAVLAVALALWLLSRRRGLGRREGPA